MFITSLIESLVRISRLLCACRCFESGFAFFLSVPYASAQLRSDSPTAECGLAKTPVVCSVFLEPGSRPCRTLWPCPCHDLSNEGKDLGQCRSRNQSRPRNRRRRRWRSGDGRERRSEPWRSVRAPERPDWGCRAATAEGSETGGAVETRLCDRRSPLSFCPPLAGFGPSWRQYWRPSSREAVSWVPDLPSPSWAGLSLSSRAPWLPL